MISQLRMIKYDNTTQNNETISQHRVMKYDYTTHDIEIWLHNTYEI